MTEQSSFFAEVPRSAFEVPGRSRGFLDVIQWRYLLSLLVRTGVTTRYRNSVLGWTWSYVRPGAQFLVFWVVMGLFLDMGRGVPNYAVYLFSGIIVINLFSEAYKNATTSIVGNAPLVRKVYLPRQLFAVSAVIVAFIHFLPQLGLLAVVGLLMGWWAHFSILQVVAIVVGIALITLFALGLGLFFGALNVRFRDAENVVELLLMLATWASPVLYHWTMVAEAASKIHASWITQIYLINPITQAVELFHYAFWLPVTDLMHSEDKLIQAAPVDPNLLTNTLWAFVIAIFVFAFGQLVFRKLEGRFAQDL